VTHLRLFSLFLLPLPALSLSRLLPHCLFLETLAFSGDGRALCDTLSTLRQPLYTVREFEMRCSFLRFCLEESHAAVIVTQMPNLRRLNAFVRVRPFSDAALAVFAARAPECKVEVELNPW